MAAFNVRVFGHRGVQQMPLMLPKQYSSDSVYTLVQPYEWGAILAVNGAVPAASPAQASPDQTQVLRVEVPDGMSIRYEIIPPNQKPLRVPGAGSPILSGHDQFYFQQGWIFSCVDAASFA